MGVLLDDDHLISALEKVPGSPVAVIEELGIEAVLLAHAELFRQSDQYHPSGSKYSITH
jgi:hypothetical protein